MARTLFVQDDCPRCKRGSGSPREVGAEEMRAILDGLPGLLPGEEGGGEHPGIVIQLGANFDFSADGGTSKYSGTEFTFKDLCDPCKGTVLNYVVRILGDTTLTPEENPHQKKARKVKPEEPVPVD